MSQDQAKQLLLQGINLAKAGQKDQARPYIQNALRLDPRNETAWLWMSSVAKDERERVFCFQNVLQINPQNETALKALRAMNIDPARLGQAVPEAPRPSGVIKSLSGAATPEPTSGVIKSLTSSPPTPPATGGVPMVGQERIQAVLGGVEDFLRGYRALPTLSEAWTHKTRGRFGEDFARRQRTTRLAALGGVGVLGLVVLAVALFALLGRGGDETTVALRPTNTFTFTPTFTATATPGVTNTPSVTPQFTEVAFEPPDNLSKGSIFGSTPTAVFPPLNTGLGREFANAVALVSIGDYEAALPVLEGERRANESTGLGCIPDPYYYQVLALAEQQQRLKSSERERRRALLSDAEDLVNKALERQGCAESPLIYTAACLVDYLQVLEGDITQFERAAGWCDAALVESQRPIVLSATTRARLYLLESPANYDLAAATLDRALEIWPSDLNLLLVRARVELSRGELGRALEFIAQALYVDPLSEPALRLRVEAYLSIAAQTANPNRAKQLYGTAVLWSQEYLLFYAGKPAGYVLLARARLGEGNLNLAEEALLRVLQAPDLPPSEASVVAEARDLYVQLLTDTARYDLALREVERLLADEPQNIRFLARRTDLAGRLGRTALEEEGIKTLLETGALNEEAVRFYQLRLAELKTEVCWLAQNECDYQAVSDLLSDNFINDLDSTQDEARARAYRAKATYHLTQDASGEELSQNQRERAYQRALDDLEAALKIRSTPLDVYYRGLILEAFEQPSEALLAYEWVRYWAQSYPLPERLADEVAERREALAEENT
jgi:Tfp pilus assembly protein PilF